MAEVRLLKIDPTTGASIEHSTSDSITFQDGAFGGSLSATGDFSVNTNKFTVSAATGDTSVAGILGVTGAGSFGGALDMTTHQINNLAAGTLSTDAINLGQLNSALSGLTSSLQWREPVIAITADADLQSAVADTALASLLPFSDDEGTAMVIGDFAAGDYILSKNNAGADKLWIVWDDAGTLKITDVGVTALDNYHTFFVKNDICDSPAGRETSGIYSYNGTDLVKVGDFDWNLATGIDIAAGYVHNLSQAGVVTVGDSIQTALEKIGGNVLLLISDLASTDLGKGASLVGIYDALDIITATTVEGALAENRTAIDAIEDNTITSPNGSISVAGSVGGDDQTVDVVFSTTGEANRSIQASDLADHTGAADGASLVGFEYTTAGNWLADNTTVKAALDELADRLTLEEGKDSADSLQDAYELGNSIITSAVEGDIVFSGTEAFDVNIATDFSANVTLSGGADLTAAAGSALSGFDSIEGILSGNLVDKSAAESISGVWSFDANPKIQDAGNDNYATLAVADLAADRVYTMPEAGADAYFVMSEGDMTINGEKIFSNIDLNSQFQIGGVATSANVSAANLGTLTAGSTSNADSLHSHTGAAIEMTAGENLAQAGAKDVVYISANDTVAKASASALATAKAIGFAVTAVSSAAQAFIATNGSKIIGVLSGATAGAQYYLSTTAGALSTSIPTQSGEVIMPIGFALNATDLFVQIGEPRVRA